jgi:hypothetical protein
MLCVRWEGGLEFGENMVVGESNVMPARRRGQTWTSFPGSAQHATTFRHHFPAHDHHCHRIVKSSCTHCPKCMCEIPHTTTLLVLWVSHSCAPGDYLLCLTLSPSDRQASTRSSAHPPSSSTAGVVVLFPRGGRFTRAKRPTFLSLMKLTITIGHEGCEGIVS